MSNRGWLVTVAGVGCRKFASGITGGGSRRLASNDHRKKVVSESWSTKFLTLKTNTSRVKELSNGMWIILNSNLNPQLKLNLAPNKEWTVSPLQS